MYRRYGFVNPRYSSRPADLTGWNGLNFAKSEGVPTSRLERVRTYLRTNGPRSKRDILRDVFNRPDVDTSWGSGFFQYAVKQGYFHKERKGNVTYWSV